jgi:hypothetical protein
MDRCVGAAAMLPESDRQSLAIQALAGSATISDLSGRGSKAGYTLSRVDAAGADDGTLDFSAVA